MSQNTVIISTQTFENYGTSEAPHWKPKGEQTFKLITDTDSFLYGEDTCIKAIETLLVRQSNTLFRYEYRSHDIIFHEPVELDSTEFETELNNEFAKINT